MTSSRSKPSPRLTIDISQEIIDHSTQRDSSHCMIAEAIQASVPNAKYISVDLATIRFTDLIAGVRYIYLTPRPAQLAILDFDQGNKPEPFTVRLQGASVLPTGNANKSRATLKDLSTSTSNRPTRVGGTSPPLGPLPGGPSKTSAGQKATGGGAGNRTGRRREFGLRGIIR